MLLGWGFSLIHGAKVTIFSHIAKFYDQNFCDKIWQQERKIVRKYYKVLLKENILNFL